MMGHIFNAFFSDYINNRVPNLFITQLIHRSLTYHLRSEYYITEMLAITTKTFNQGWGATVEEH